jgi:hypothetical protein
MVSLIARDLPPDLQEIQRNTDHIDSDQTVLYIKHQHIQDFSVDIGKELLTGEFKYLPGIAEDLPTTEKRTVANKRYALSWNAVVSS